MTRKHLLRLFKQNTGKTQVRVPSTTFNDVQHYGFQIPRVNRIYRWQKGGE